MLEDQKELAILIMPFLPTAKIALKLIATSMQSINFSHTNRTMLSLLMISNYCSTPLNEDVEYLSQTISALSFLPPPKKGEDFNCNTSVQIYVTRCDHYFLKSSSHP